MLAAAMLFAWDTRGVPVSELWHTRPRLFVETTATRDENVDYPEPYSGYFFVPQKPQGAGWILWNNSHAKFSDWVRVKTLDGKYWKPTRPTELIYEPKNCEQFGLYADSQLYREHVQYLQQLTLAEMFEEIYRSQRTCFVVFFSRPECEPCTSTRAREAPGRFDGDMPAVPEPSKSYHSDCGCRVAFFADRWRQ